MQTKFKKLKKFVSVAIVMTIIVSLFMPTVSAQAAETQALENAVSTYVDVENSPYQITSVEFPYYSNAYVEYSVPADCTLISAVYDSVSHRMVYLETQTLSADSESTYVYFSDTYSRKFTAKFFLVDDNFHPLGKSYTTEEIDNRNNSIPDPSYGYRDMKPHKQTALKQDGGKLGSMDWTLSTDGTLAVSGFTWLYSSGKHAVPWDSYRDSITSISFINNDNSYSGSYDSGLFNGLSKIKSVSLPSGCYFNSECFYDLESLETVYIEPSNDEYELYYISAGNFSKCPNLKKFVVSENDACYSVVDGVLYDKDKTVLVKYPAGKIETSFTIPDTVTHINERAFEDAVNLKSINMSDNVYNIGKGAFKNCTSLENIKLSKGLYSLSEELFYNCTNLKDIDIPESVYSMYGACFANTGIESIYIPKYVSDIYCYAYNYSNSIEELNDVRYNQFANCKSLKSIEVASDNVNYLSIDGVLFGKGYSDEELSLISYPTAKQDKSYVVPDNVTSIDACAFECNKYLEHINLGNRVNTIDRYAFKNCSSLKDIELNNVNTINEGAFFGCTKLETINIPASVYSLPYDSSLFVYCDSLKSITVDEDNSSYKSFDDCLYKLKYDYSRKEDNYVLTEYPNAKGSVFSLPDTVDGVKTSTDMDDYAFAGRRSLKSVTIPEGVESVSGFKGCTNLTEVKLPSTCTTIGQSAFEDCTSLVNIDLADHVTKISDYAFRNCSSLKSVDFGDHTDFYKNGMLSIGLCAFMGAGLESLFIPNATQISDLAFYDCQNLKSVKFESSWANGSSYNSDSYKVTLEAFFKLTDDLTVYYPAFSTYWDSITMTNIMKKNAIKYVEYDDSEYVRGRYSKGTYTFTGLKPNTEYIVVFNNKYYNVSAITNNTLYVDMIKSDANGNLECDYALKSLIHKDFVVPFALCAAETDISGAEIIFGRMVAIGDSMPVNITVTYNGKELKQNVDYLVINGYSYYSKGNYEAQILGIGSYFGTLSATYTVELDKYDVNRDGYIDINDATDIQKYLAGYKEIDLAYADFNGDGEVSVDDVTSLQKELAAIR